MSISTVSQPQIIFPVYSIFGVPWAFSSTLSAATSFNLVVDLYSDSYSGTNFTNRIRNRATLSPTDNLFHYSPARVLENYLSYDLNPFITTPALALNTSEYYKLRLGEEYEQIIFFSAVTDNGSGFAKFQLSGTVGSLVTGAEVFISQNEQQTSVPNYSGWWTVSGTGSLYIVTNAPYTLYSATTINGYITKIIVFDPSYTNINCVFAGTNQYLDYGKNFSATYLLSGSTSEFLTPYSGIREIGTNEPYTFTGIYKNSTYYTVNVYDSSNALLGTSNVNTTFTTVNGCNPAIIIPVGTSNLSSIFSSYPTAARYTIQMFNGGTPNSRIYEFKIVNKCSIYPTYYLTWLNSRGGFDSFTLNYKSVLTDNIKRDTFSKIIRPNYTLGTRSETVLNVDSNTSILLNTNFINERYSALLMDVMNSDEVYLIDSSNNIIPVVVTVDKPIYQTSVNNRLVQYRVTANYAFDNVRQRN
jgi:hypothetical protein